MFDPDPPSLAKVHRGALVQPQAIGGAIARGLDYLRSVQLPSGEFPTFATTDPDMAQRCEFDPSVFPTALIARSLAACQEASLVRDRACDFLLAEMDANGLWRHWTRDHPLVRQLPPDVDDTSCASSALRANGRAFPDNRALLLANRDSRGRFFTWIAPRLGWRGRHHFAVTLAQLRHAPTLWLFFRRTSARPHDVDAVVNANALFYLGDFAGRDRVVAFLLDAVRQGRETMCDKWYDNPFVIWYFLSHALAGSPEVDAALFVARIEAARPRTALDRALAACALLCWGRAPADGLVAGLLAAQKADGSWPIAPLYHGGRARRRGAGFAEPHPDTPRWGSEALTTAFAIEALAKLRGGSPRMR